MRDTNELYPIFLKVNELSILVVGGGNVAYEKLSFLFKSSPHAIVEVVATTFQPRVLELCKKHQAIISKKNYSKASIKDRQIVIAATNDTHVNRQIYYDAKESNVLINVADTPRYCDFYLGGIVTKGNVKIAISTNGKSPTVAKRLRQFLESIIPDDISGLVDNINTFRSSIKADFSEKVTILNKMTEGLVEIERK